MNRLILAVEDDFAIANLYATIFSDDRVLVADSAQEALRLLTVEQPDLIILDLGLRGSHGLAVINGLGTERPPILIVSAQHDADAVARLVGAEVMQKPFDVDRLIAKVERMLATSRVQEATHDG